MKMNELIDVLAQSLHAANIHLRSGTGEGPTPRAAFDAALRDAGAAHCNRLRESSLIAPNSSIVRASPHASPYGDRYRRCVVMAQMQQSQPGLHAHAGIGWVQRSDDASGLFIDLHGDCHDRLEHDLREAFGAIPALRDAAYGAVQALIASRRCDALPVCALVVAAYAREWW